MSTIHVNACFKNLGLIISLLFSTIKFQTLKIVYILNSLTSTLWYNFTCFMNWYSQVTIFLRFFFLQIFSLTDVLIFLRSFYPLWIFLLTFFNTRNGNFIQLYGIPVFWKYSNQKLCSWSWKKKHVSFLRYEVVFDWRDESMMSLIDVVF